jgi:hypothetical protein
MLVVCAFVPMCVSVMAEPPQLPSGMFIQAAPTDDVHKIRVTWKDFLDEDYYELYENLDATPGPILGAGDNGWRFITSPVVGATEFVYTTIFSATYAICGWKELEMTCFGPSNYATPKQPPDPARVDSLQIFSITKDRLGLQWMQSPNTKYSRAEVKEESNIVSAVENDSDQSVMFSDLQPKRTYALSVCVRNDEQTAANETCRSIPAETFPDIPLAPSSVGIHQGDDNPRQRTVDFSYNNRSSNAVVGIVVQLIKDNQSVTVHTV